MHEHVELHALKSVIVSYQSFNTPCSHKVKLLVVGRQTQVATAPRCR